MRVHAQPPRPLPNQPERPAHEIRPDPRPFRGGPERARWRDAERLTRREGNGSSKGGSSRDPAPGSGGRSGSGGPEPEPEQDTLTISGAAMQALAERDSGADPAPAAPLTYGPGAVGRH